MKWITLLAALAVLGSGCVKDVRTAQESDYLNDIEETISAQEQVNYYFHKEVTPKLRTCWGSVKGEGTIELGLTYTSEKGLWVFESAKTIRSNLAAAQDAVALRCMQDAAAGTSFELRERKGGKSFEKFLVKWIWVVPLPPEGSEAMARSVSEVEPDKKGCAKCITTYPGARCQWSEKGAEADCRVDGPYVCSTSGTKCLTGIYGRAGDGVIIF